MVCNRMPRLPLCLPKIQWFAEWQHTLLLLAIWVGLHGGCRNSEFMLHSPYLRTPPVYCQVSNDVMRGYELARKLIGHKPKGPSMGKIIATLVEASTGPRHLEARYLGAGRVPPGPGAPASRGARCGGDVPRVAGIMGSDTKHPKLA